MHWISIENLDDNDKIARGAAFKLLPTKEGALIGNYIPKCGLIYILVDLPGEDHMCLTCLSEGEEGNTMSLLKKQGTYVLGKEVKRMLLDKIQIVLINKMPKYEIK